MSYELSAERSRQAVTGPHGTAGGVCSRGRSRRTGANGAGLERC